MRFIIANKTLLGFSVSILLIIIVGASAYFTISKYDENTSWVNHTYEVIQNIDDLDKQVLSMENSGRAYILTGDETNLIPFEVADHKTGYLVDRIQTLTADNLSQQRRIEALRPLLSERLQLLREGVELRKKLPALDPLVQTPLVRGRELGARLDRVLTSMRDDEMFLLAERNTKMDKSKEYAIYTDEGGTLIALIVVLVLLWYITKTFQERLKAEEKLKESNISLAEVSAENQRRNWILSGASELNGRLRGEMSLEELAQQTIETLCTYIDAKAGAFYLMNEERTALTLAGSFALSYEAPMEVSLKEGLIGQAAYDEKTLSLSEVPGDYFPIRSGLGEATPRHIIVMPIRHEEGVKGVIELATLDVIPERSMDFLDFVSKDISVAIHTAESRNRLNLLNDRLQKQANELQLQQEELQAGNEELIRQSEQLQASEEELKAQQEELQRTNRYKSEFLANMSHELRTPLNSILILAKILSENKEVNLTSKQVEYAKVIHKSGQDLLTLINAVLDLTKIESGKTTLSIGRVSLEETRMDMEALFREVASAGKIQYITRIEPGCPPEINTDKVRLEQILRNLLSNAFKFTGEKGKIELHIAATPLQGGIAFYVRDNGIGIPKDKQELIFQAFRQADGSTNRKFGGTGLGLSISRQLAAMLGGEIRVESEIDKGSTFSLYLPVQYFSSFGEVAAEEPGEPVALSGARTLLIAEDDPIFAGIIREFAVEKGYEVIVAARGDLVVPYTLQYRPLAILLDIQLPNVDGWTLLEQLKANPSTKHIPVHVISGSPNREKGISMGAIDFLNKPLGVEDIESLIGSLSRYPSPSVRKVLIVEDDRLQSEQLEKVLGERGISTLSASDGRQAIQFLHEDVFDCVILDLTLPDMSGFSLLEHMEQLHILPMTKVIIHTAREVNRDDEIRLRRFTDTIILKEGRSQERLLNEIALFLHRVNEKKFPSGPTYRQPASHSDDLLKNKKVLLVEDDMRNVFALSATLRTHGLEVVIAADGHEALHQLGENPDTQLVLMDIMMPEMDGYEAMRQIRKDKKYKALPVIALTAKAMKEDREKCMEAGASDYITKPVDVDQLLSLIRVWLYNGKEH